LLLLNVKKKQVSKKSEPQKPVKVLNWKIILILTIAVFAFYGNSINNGFSMDDDLVTRTDTQRHPRVEKGFAGIPEILTTHYVETSRQSYAYRPVTTISFAIEYQFFGQKSNEERAHVSHFINVVLFLLIVLLIYYLSIKLLGEKNKVAALFIALLFTIHPIHTEVVDNIKSRDELLVMLFGILSLLSFLRYVDSGFVKRKYVILGFTFLVLSYFSKKTGMVYFALIPLTVYFFRNLKLRAIALYFATLILVFITLKLIMSGGSDSIVREKMFFENPLYFNSSIGLKVSMFFYSMLYYILLMIVPYPLRYYYGYNQIPVATFENPLVWIGALVVIGLTVISLLKIKKKPIWAFGILFFFLGIGGAANLLFPAVGIIAERFTFSASLGLIFAGGYYASIFVEQVNWSRNIKVSLLAGVVLISLLQVTSRNSDWESRYSLYKNDIVHLENSAKAHSLLGSEYVTICDSLNRQGKINFTQYLAYTDSAIAQFDKALEVYPDYFNCSNNAGVMYYSRKQDPFTAKQYFRKAIDSRPTYVEALFNYGNCLESEYAIRVELESVLDDLKSDSLNSMNSDDKFVLDNGMSKSLYFTFYLKQQVGSALNKQKFNDPNWKQKTLNASLPMIRQGLITEDGFYHNEIGDDQIEADVKKVFAINESDPNKVYNVLIGYLIKQNELVLLQNGEFNLNDAYEKTRDEKNNLLDSMIIYWDSSYHLNPDYTYALNKLNAVYKKQEMYDELIELNQFAIEKSSLIKTNFYLSIASVYNFRGEIDKAIEEMLSAAEYLISEQKKIQDSNFNEEQKQKKLLSFSQQLQKVYGFLATLYSQKGDTEKAIYYQGLK